MKKKRTLKGYFDCKKNTQGSPQQQQQCDQENQPSKQVEKKIHNLKFLQKAMENNQKERKELIAKTNDFNGSPNYSLSANEGGYESRRGIMEKIKQALPLTSSSPIRSEVGSLLSLNFKDSIENRKQKAEVIGQTIL